MAGERRPGADAALGERLPGGTLDPAGLAMLSDALEEAGCREEALLRHLRGEDVCYACQGTGWVARRGPHARGCWALDLVLGRA